MPHHAKPTRVLLIDDDPIFRSLMAEIAQAREITLDAYDSLLELESMDLIEAYDVAIVDYQLQGTTGIQICKHLEAFFKDTPVVLVSSLDNCEILESYWPKPIAKFINKNAGCDAILLSAIAVSVWKNPKEVPNEEKPEFSGKHLGRSHPEELLPHQSES